MIISSEKGNPGLFQELFVTNKSPSSSLCDHGTIFGQITILIFFQIWKFFDFFEIFTDFDISYTFRMPVSSRSIICTLCPVSSRFHLISQCKTHELMTILLMTIRHSMLNN